MRRSEFERLLSATILVLLAASTGTGIVRLGFLFLGATARQDASPFSFVGGRIF